MKIRTLAVLGLVLVLGGCYHAIIDTGMPASGTVIEEPWAMSFVGGLIPPPLVDVASRCPNGVSRVETQHSFLNSLVGGITSGIITPMTITVTCAAGGMGEAGAADTEVIDASSASPEDMVDALNAAARRSWQELGSPVYVSMPLD